MNPFYSDFVDIKFALLQQMPNIFVFFFIVFGSWFFERFVISAIFKKLIIHYNHLQMEFRKEICEHIEKPVRHLFFSTGFLSACAYALNVSLFTFDPLFKIYKTLLIFIFFQAIYYVTHYFGEHPDAFKTKFNIKAENVLFPFFARVVKVVIFIFIFAIVAYEWGYDINGLVTGLGIGGLAIALGAKDMLSHIFAGIAIAMDKPFNIGDLISTSKNLEGVVEDMNFRSTKIRTLDKALVSVPNAVIANEYIYNWSRRQNRRVRFILGVTYSTTEEQLKKVTQRIKEVVTNHIGVEADTTTVSFDNYAPSSLDILVQYVTNTSDFNEFVLIKEDINYQIMKILKQENVNIAFPSQSLYFMDGLSIAEEKSGQEGN